MISEAIGKVVDKLPPWGKFIFYVFTLVISVYGIARYGLGRMLLRALLSP
jgi:hypothetical protein